MPASLFHFSKGVLVNLRSRPCVPPIILSVKSHDVMLLQKYASAVTKWQFATSVPTAHACAGFQKVQVCAAGDGT